MALSTCLLTHVFTNADGTPSSGVVEFSLTGRMTNGTTTIVPASINAALSSSGALSQSLTSNLDAATVPQNAQWRVDLRILGLQPETLFITVPSAVFTANTTITTPTLSSVSSFGALAVGQTVTGAGIPGGTTITAINSVAGTATMSNNATATASAVPITISALTIDLGVLLPQTG